MFTPVTFFELPRPLPFIMVVKSDNTGTSNSDQFTLTGAALRGGSTFKVNFSPIADPTNITNVILSVSNPTITFPSIGSYIVRVDDRKFSRIQFNNGGDRLKLLTITQWGGVVWSSMLNAFFGCSNMDVTATDYPDLSRCTTLESMLRSCSSLVGTSDFNDWDVSNITNMNSLFQSATSFNQPIGNWDVSNVTTMVAMFRLANAFNQNINGWNVGNVINMQQMFQQFPNNINITSWDVSKVTNMSLMFQQASTFNQNIGGWDVSSVTNMTEMFRQAGAFQGNIGLWNVSNVTNMNLMFALFGGGNGFNQDISGWNVSKVSNMSFMFQFNRGFNQNIGSWQLRTAGVNMANMWASTGAVSLGRGMSCANWTDTIVGWANYVNANSGPKSVTVSGDLGDRVFADTRSGGASFADSSAARAYLTGALPDGGWSISGDVRQPTC
jgi:surface protein